MMDTTPNFKNFRRHARLIGQGMTELIIILTVIGIGSIFVYTQFGDVLRNQTAVGAKALAGQGSGTLTAAAQAAADAATSGTSGGMGNFAGGGGGYSGGDGASGGDGGTSGGEDGASGSDGETSGGGDGSSDGDDLASPGAGGRPDGAWGLGGFGAVGDNPLDDPHVQALIALSPTLQADINGLLSEGWRFIYTDEFSHIDDRNGNKFIRIQNDTNEVGVVQKIAHEVGHLKSPLRNTWRSIRDKEPYVQRRLEDEGAAVVYNIKVRDEILANGGQNIHVDCDGSSCDTRYSNAYDKYINGDAAGAYRDIADLRADELMGNNVETYREYYTRSWYHRQSRRESRGAGRP